MEENLKQLLLKDLCARLPSYVKAKDKGGAIITICAYHPYGIIDNYGIMHNVSNIKPYLFPMSSMTDEQKSYMHFNTKFNIDRFETITLKIDEDDSPMYVEMEDWLALFDWFNKNHFDYRGLIEKGLALDATGLNIY